MLLWLWTAFAGLVFGLLGAGEVPEDLLRSARNRLHPQAASGDIVLVAIDDRSLRRIGQWPWPRRTHAQLVERLHRAGARQIYFDTNLSFSSTAPDDAQFAAALRRSGRVVLPAQFRMGTASGESRPTLPLPEFAAASRLGVISVNYNWQQAVWRLPFAALVDGRPLPSYAAMLAGLHGPVDRDFRIDYSIQPSSVPQLSAADVVLGRLPAGAVAGKSVVIGGASLQLKDDFYVPGSGRMSGVIVHILGAETLKKGVPTELGWAPAFLFALLVSGFAVLQSRAMRWGPTLALAAMLLLAAPMPLEAHLLFLDIMPGLFVLATVAGAMAWRRHRQRALVDPLSGLANLNALRSYRAGRDRPLATARIHNFAEIVSALPPDGEARFVEQVISRLALGSGASELFQGDGGVFVWFAEGQTIGHHLEALYALFRNPVRLGQMQLDVHITFGVEIGSGRSLQSRLGSALVAAEEAAAEGLKWKLYDPAKLQDVSWRLSLLSQLDRAIDNGELWVAFQPKLDLRTGRICGAEALARWTHPEKGPISPMEFIAAAEQNDRIERLTLFVLDRAIAAAAGLNKRDGRFGIAVNLSAKLLVNRSFPSAVAARLAEHGLKPERLTLELTETAALADDGTELELLAELRQHGINISIDDYGTGMSTLEYLKKIPAGEIKIDQSFIKSIRDNRSDRLMVQSTIALAHSLGRTVVAEGAEDKATVDLLGEMECDFVQGFAVGRPVDLTGLTRGLLAHGRTAAA